jgi:hypothetical protein
LGVTCFEDVTYVHTFFIDLARLFEYETAVLILSGGQYCAEEGTNFSAGYYCRRREISSVLLVRKLRGKLEGGVDLGVAKDN